MTDKHTDKYLTRSMNKMMQWSLSVYQENLMGLGIMGRLLWALRLMISKRMGHSRQRNSLHKYLEQGSGVNFIHSFL